MLIEIDPQPLCKDGLACPGVCLPMFGGKFSQPDNIRNQIWDKVMSEGIYQVKVTVTKVIQLPEEYDSTRTLVRRVKRSETTAI